MTTVKWCPSSPRPPLKIFRVCENVGITLSAFVCDRKNEAMAAILFFNLKILC